MDIAFQSRNLAKTFNSERDLTKAYGDRLARRLMMRRMAILRSALTLAMVPTSRPERRHQLSGRRRGQFAVDLVQPYRLVFNPDNDPVPIEKMAELTRSSDRDQILEVIDYH